MLVAVHVDLVAVKRDTFRLEEGALGFEMLALGANDTSCPNHALPGKRVSFPVKQLDNLAVIAGIARGGRDFGVCRNFAAGNAEDNKPHGLLAVVIAARAEAGSLEALDFQVVFSVVGRVFNQV